MATAARTRSSIPSESSNARKAFKTVEQPSVKFRGAESKVLKPRSKAPKRRKAKSIEESEKLQIDGDVWTIPAADTDPCKVVEVDGDKIVCVIDDTMKRGEAKKSVERYNQILARSNRRAAIVAFNDGRTRAIPVNVDAFAEARAPESHRFTAHALQDLGMAFEELIDTLRFEVPALLKQGEFIEMDRVERMCRSIALLRDFNTDLLQAVYKKFPKRTEVEIKPVRLQTTAVIMPVPSDWTPKGIFDVPPGVECVAKPGHRGAEFYAAGFNTAAMEKRSKHWAIVPDMLTTEPAERLELPGRPCTCETPRATSGKAGAK